MATQTVAESTVGGNVSARAERTQWQMAFERFRAHRPAMVGLFVLATLAFLSAAAPIVSPYDPEKTALLFTWEAPSAAHPFGTDGLGRDLATRILYGGRVSLAVGLLAVTVAVSVGTLVGMVAGYYGRWVDGVPMRFVDMMYSFPRLFLLILFGVIFKGMTLGVIVIVLGLLSWMTTSRLVRASFLALKHREFVEAARCSARATGESSSATSCPTHSRRSSSRRRSASLARSSPRARSEFLGLGIQPPTPSWGNMLNHRDHRDGQGSLDGDLPRPLHLPRCGLDQFHRRRAARRARPEARRPRLAA